MDTMSHLNIVYTKDAFKLFLFSTIWLNKRQISI